MRHYGVPTLFGLSESFVQSPGIAVFLEDDKAQLSKTKLPTSLFGFVQESGPNALASVPFIYCHSADVISLIFLKHAVWNQN